MADGNGCDRLDRLFFGQEETGDDLRALVLYPVRLLDCHVAQMLRTRSTPS